MVKATVNKSTMTTEMEEYAVTTAHNAFDVRKRSKADVAEIIKEYFDEKYG